MSRGKDDLLELRKILKYQKFGDETLVRTRLELIWPQGVSSAYAVNDAGNVVGFKSGNERVGWEFLKRISRFPDLERAVIFINEPTEFPEEILKLRRLKYLYIVGPVTKLPPGILDLHLPIIPYPTDGMETLSPPAREEIVENLRTERQLARIEREEASFEDTYRRAYEFSVSASEEILNIQGIFLPDAALEDPPLEIARRGREAIAAYFRERRGDALPLNELKVLLVGNGAAGKTSLVKRIFGEEFNVDEPQTHGINIRSRSVTVADGQEVKLNFWDFGGQEIMHATHQFFLSRRSMYILVLDGRKEEDPEYWLQHIESFGGDSPVMVVLNKIDEHPSFEVNRRFLNTKYSGIVDFFRVSCASGVGVSEFTQRLVEELRRVAMIQTIWPRDWFRVKQRLEGAGTAYVSLSEYRAICEEENVKEVESQELLVDFLNDLGVVLHFKDIELLDTHVLDPRWVTEAVYRIINSKILAEQKGFLRLSQLAQVLAPPRPGACAYPPDKHRYIVDLMLKFELCYELADNAILVPDLLDIQEPAMVFQHEDALRFVFEYTYLPKSIMPRFIVRMHRDIKGGTRWRTGVLLEDKSFGAVALVVADEKDKRIRVSVVGRQKRDYFAVIRKVINDLNSSFEKIGVTELVPLPDVSDVFIDYRELVGYEQAGREEYFVGRLQRGYNVQTLLNGIEKKSSRQHRTIVVEGDYFDNSSVGSTKHTVTNVGRVEIGGKMGYTPQNWEKVIVYLTGFLFLGVVSFLAIRNQPIADKNLVVLLRIILSLVVAVFGATVPGMLRVDFSAKGLTIRAIGALALFVITYLLTPEAL